MIEPWKEHLLRQLYESADIDSALRADPNALEQMWGALGEQLRDIDRMHAERAHEERNGRPQRAPWR